MDDELDKSELAKYLYIEYNFLVLPDHIRMGIPNARLAKQD